MVLTRPVSRSGIDVLVASAAWPATEPDSVCVPVLGEADADAADELVPLEPQPAAATPAAASAAAPARYLCPRALFTVAPL